MVDDGRDRKNASQNAHYVDEKGVPLIVRVDVQYSHGVGFVPEVDHGKLCQDDFVEPCSINIQFLSFFVVFIDDILLNDIQEVGIGNSHKHFLYLFLGVEVA